MKKPVVIILFVLSLLPQIVLAKALIFIQGYDEDGSEWRSHGVTAMLMANGWSDGGHLIDNGTSVMMPSQVKGADQFYTIALPTEAPLMFQLPILARYIDTVNLRHQSEPLILVGHSAGGVLARLYMVQNPLTAVAGLVTIASPHRGTGLSEAGLMVGQSPLSWGLPIIGANSINRSQGLFYDLVREAPGNFLFWLNRELHPVSRYLSVIRNDWVISNGSQDMRSVAALYNSGMVETAYAAGNHALNPYDGRILVDFLATIK
ncbi:MAG: alpha/beta hydrolase [Gammaproteobacteria bacterium]|nr:alpha/beta hydrolase [Gammaproteobacteria bacterium]